MILWWINLLWAHQLPEDYRTLQAKRFSQELLRMEKYHQVEEIIEKGNLFLHQVLRSSEIEYTLGLICNRADRLDDALSFYMLALETNPKMFEARYDRAELYLAQGKWEKAQHDLMYLIQSEVKHPMISLRLAEIAIQKQQPEEMYTYLQDAVHNGLSVEDLIPLGWGRWSTDPLFASNIQSVVLLYGGHSIWNQLISSP